MATVDDLLTTDWWGPCLPEDLLEQAFSLQSKGTRIPRTCSEAPTRDPEIVAEMIGRYPTPLEMAGASYAYCREYEIEDCYWDSPGGDLPGVVPLPATAILLIAAFAVLFGIRRGGGCSSP